MGGSSSVDVCWHVVAAAFGGVAVAASGGVYGQGGTCIAYLDISHK